MPKKSSEEFESWLNKTWRPAIAWAYIVICVFDFIIFPILWSILQAAFSGTVSLAWNPITMSGGGLLHLSMGAILGIYAFSRGQEKMLRSKHDSLFGLDDNAQSEQRPNRPTRPGDLGSRDTNDR